MSLGAIDFGLIVDGAVIIVENSLRRLAEEQHRLGRILKVEERLRVVLDASRQVLVPAAFGVGIIIIVYVPILFLTGVEGKMFRPMATTVIFALTSAFVLSLTFVPAMIALAITGKVQEKQSWFIRTALRVYEPLLHLALRHRVVFVAAPIGVFVGSLVLFARLGQEFAPTLSELDIAVHAIRIPSTALSQSQAMQKTLEHAVSEIPEVALVFSKTGTAEIASDPMPPSMSDNFVILKPRPEWPDPSKTKEDVRLEIEKAIERLPGQNYEFTQPIAMRFNELIAGVRADVAVKLFGEDFAALLPVAEQVGAILGETRGAADVRIEQIAGLPVLEVDVDRKAIARYGLTVADVQDVVSIAVGGRAAGELFQGDRRFDIMVRLPEEFRRTPSALENLPIPLTHADQAPAALSVAARRPEESTGFLFLPLGSVAKIRMVEGPNQVSRENGQRRVVVQTNVRGRDIGTFVEEVKRRVARELVLPAGSWIEWGGQFQNLVEAKARLSVVVPACFILILTLLYGALGSLREALLVFTGVPLALSGGIVSLWLRGMPFSMSAAIGFIALSGVAVLNGLVMVSFISQLRAEGMPGEEAIVRGALTRLRPVLMTALVASLGFVPMAIATGTGAEVQRPLATVVIGGLITSTALTLLVLPALYAWIEGQRRLEDSEPG
jgi:cobalt-zinc-cadmium resistance protein CzcA